MSRLMSRVQIISDSIPDSGFLNIPLHPKVDKNDLLPFSGAKHRVFGTDTSYNVFTDYLKA